ncbi:MAG: hypothetical protein JKY89_02220 [Immundisolibacteraceae bacterium]|nr:hypothetical protein [Immundisolibacteraceae bacterium]
MISLLSNPTSSRAEPETPVHLADAHNTNTANAGQKASSAPTLELLQFLGDWQPDNHHWLEQLQQLDQLIAEPLNDVGATP